MAATAPTLSQSVWPYPVVNRAPIDPARLHPWNSPDTASTPTHTVASRENRDSASPSEGVAPRGTSTTASTASPPAHTQAAPMWAIVTTTVSQPGAVGPA